MFESLAGKLKKTQFFSDREAWNLFRLAAFGEAFGWTLLISGIIYRALKLPNNHDVLQVAGQLHGTLFGIYFVALFVLWGSLRWSGLEMIIAAAVSVPPYGTLVYEQWQARRRKASRSASERQIVGRVLIEHDNKHLVILPADRAFWCLPGGVVQQGETPEQAAVRAVFEQTGITAKVGGLRYIFEYQHSSKQARMEFIFGVTNAGAFKKLGQATNVTVEAIQFMKLSELADFEPSFLQTTTSKNTSYVQFVSNL